MPVYFISHALFVLLYRQLDDVISNLSKNFAEGTEYFKVDLLLALHVSLGWVFSTTLFCPCSVYMSCEASF